MRQAEIYRKEILAGTLMEADVEYRFFMREIIDNISREKKHPRAIVILLW